MFRGVVGQIKWAYYMAAAINGYEVTRTDDGLRLRGTVIQHDAFKLTQRPLMFVAPTKLGECRWPIETFELHDGQITARLGPPVR
jgi:hypothetical protein